MSLFGTSPDDDLPSRTKSSGLFEDEPKAGRRANNSLFADDLEGPGDSPWAFPSPKKAGRGNLVKTLLPASEVPESYIDLFDSLINAGERAGNGVTVSSARKLLNESDIGAEQQAKISEVVGLDNLTTLGRGEFNVLLALIGLAKEGEELSLDTIDERRKSMLLSNHRIILSVQ
jgi:sorting nexin-8